MHVDTSNKDINEAEVNCISLGSVGGKYRSEDLRALELGIRWW
jgi:hypothetical protein